MAYAPTITIQNNVGTAVGAAAYMAGGTVYPGIYPFKVLSAGVVSVPVIEIYDRSTGVIRQKPFLPSSTYLGLISGLSVGSGLAPAGGDSGSINVGDYDNAPTNTNPDFAGRLVRKHVVLQYGVLNDSDSFGPVSLEGFSSFSLMFICTDMDDPSKVITIKAYPAVDEDAHSNLKVYANSITTVASESDTIYVSRSCAAVSDSVFIAVADVDTCLAEGTLYLILHNGAPSATATDIA